MKMILKTYKFKINPTKYQIKKINDQLGCNRFVYNHFLNERIDQYKEFGKSDNYFKQAKKLTQFKQQPELKWLLTVNSQSLQHCLRLLDYAYINFYKGTSKYPKYKSKHKINSFVVSQTMKLDDNKIYISKFKEGIEYVKDREVNGNIKRITIIKTSSGKYYASIMVELEHNQFKKTGTNCGIDLGINNIVTISDGTVIEKNKRLDEYDKKIETALKYLKTKTKGSKSYEKQRQKLTKLYEKKSNIKKDFIHKLSSKIVSEYDTICVENLDVKKMIKQPSLKTNIINSSWRTLINHIQYKCDWNDRQMIKIDRYYPSSKRCNICGCINEELKPYEKIWTCKNGHVLNRDENAAKNILEEGLKQISLGTNDYRKRCNSKKH